MSESKNNIKRLFKIVKRWANSFGIIINSNKMVYTSNIESKINIHVIDEKQKREKIQSIPPTEAYKYLGSWIQASGNENIEKNM